MALPPSWQATQAADGEQGWWQPQLWQQQRTVTIPGHTPAVPWHRKALHPSRNPATDLLPTQGLILPGMPCPAMAVLHSAGCTAHTHPALTHGHRQPSLILPGSSALPVTDLKAFCTSRASLAPWPCTLSPSPGTGRRGHCQAPERGQPCRACWGWHWAGSTPSSNGQEQFHRHRNLPVCCSWLLAVVLTAFPLHVLLRLNIIAKHTFTCNYPFMRC